MKLFSALPRRVARTAPHLCLAEITHGNVEHGAVKLHLGALSVCCMSQLGTFTRMQTKRTPVSAVRRNELSKNTTGLCGDWGRWREDQMCGKAEAAVNPESAC